MIRHSITWASRDGEYRRITLDGGSAYIGDVVQLLVDAALGPIKVEAHDSKTPPPPKVG